MTNVPWWIIGFLVAVAIIYWRFITGHNTNKGKVVPFNGILVFVLLFLLSNLILMHFNKITIHFASTFLPFAAFVWLFWRVLPSCQRKSVFLLACFFGFLTALLQAASLNYWVGNWVYSFWIWPLLAAIFANIFKKQTVPAITLATCGIWLCDMFFNVFLILYESSFPQFGGNYLLNMMVLTIFLTGILNFALSYSQTKMQRIIKEWHIKSLSKRPG